MNQFKRAKQIGNQSERITDLKTAGVATPKEKSLEQALDISVKKEEPNPVNTNAENTHITQTIIQEENTVVSKTEIPTVSPQNTTADATQISIIKTLPENISEKKPESTPQSIIPITHNEASPVQQPNTQPQVILPQQTIQPVVQPQYPEINISYTAEPNETKPAKSSKKSAPNMFTHKNESKSIRKSLVLRPSSVKIAENYCAKNGGSFNELIQILLDNFIEEYGL